MTTPTSASPSPGNDPLELARPDSLTQRIHAFARDLAYGAVTNAWDYVIQITGRGDWSGDPRYRLAGPAHEAFARKWPLAEAVSPSFALLLAYNYVSVLERVNTSTFYIITPKAFDLLDRPIAPPDIFVSYRRGESSALALLIEARCRLVGADRLFIDKGIQAGDDWRDILEKRVRSSEYMICLIGPTTLASEWVRQEITWAEASGCKLISIWHNGAVMGDDAPAELRRRQAIRVDHESARDYETAVNELLNSLGYRTY